MASCEACNTTILFGGTKDGHHRYCNDKCYEQGLLLRAADEIPVEIVLEATEELRRGACPSCAGAGPIEVFNSYRVWSALLVTSWQTRPAICCRSCATKNQLGDAAFSLFLGWWGFPWGLVMTPVQIVRNLTSLGKKPDPYQPSEELKDNVRILLVSQAMAEHQEHAVDEAYSGGALEPK